MRLKSLPCLSLRRQNQKSNAKNLIALRCHVNSNLAQTFNNFNYVGQYNTIQCHTNYRTDSEPTVLFFIPSDAFKPLFWSKFFTQLQRSLLMLLSLHLSYLSLSLFKVILFNLICIIKLLKLYPFYYYYSHIFFI